MTRSASPLEGKTTDRRAGCGRSACPVRREGGTGQPGLPTPITDFVRFGTASHGWSACADHECVREDALSARCKSVPGLVAAQ